MDTRKFNFIDKETGEKFFHSNYRIGFEGATPIYKDSSGNVLVNPKNGLPLQLIPKEVENYKNVAFLGSTGDRNVKHEKTFKDIASKHNKSEEVAHEKHKAIEREMGTDIANTTRKAERAMKK